MSDLLVLIPLLVAAFVLLDVLDVFVGIETRLDEIDWIGADELLLGVVLLLLGTAVYTWRRWRAWKREAAELDGINARLETSTRKIARQARMIDEVGASIIIVDRNGVISFGNKGMERLFGWSREEAVGANVLDLMVRPEDKVALRHYMAQAEVGYRGADQWKMKRKDGSDVWVYGMAAAIPGEGPNDVEVIAMATDITPLKELEEAHDRLSEQVQSVQKMEALGCLAGGVAHDFNNLLSIILSYARFVAEDLEPGDPRRRDVGEILTAGKRAERLVSQLLTFSRRGQVHPEVLDVNAVTTELIPMLNRALGDEVRLVFEKEPNLLRVEMDRAALGQLITDLAFNARDAMPSGGTFSIGTNNAVTPSGRVVRLTFSDTGTGMDEETQRRIFEPFFTNKPFGERTGLGLAAVHGIVENAGGQIRVASSQGEGSTFTIDLPATEAVPRAPAEERAAATATRDRTVLIVEDESAVREMARRILEWSGYTTYGAADGAEALRIAADVPRIDVLITDVVMPGMSGTEVAASIARVHPETSTIFMSGFSADVLQEYSFDRGAASYMQKPFSAEALLTSVAEASPNDA